MLAKPSAKVTATQQKFRTEGGPAVREYCPHLTKEDCRRQVPQAWCCSAQRQPGPGQCLQPVALQQGLVAEQPLHGLQCAERLQPNVQQAAGWRQLLARGPASQPSTLRMVRAGAEEAVRAG